MDKYQPVTRKRPFTVIQKFIDNAESALPVLTELLQLCNKQQALVYHMDQNELNLTSEMFLPDYEHEYLGKQMQSVILEPEQARELMDVHLKHIESRITEILDKNSELAKYIASES